MRDVTGDQLRRIAWWVDWPPMGALILVWVLVGTAFPDLSWWWLVLFMVADVVVVQVSTVWARRVRSAAEIVDAADELIASVDVLGMREVAERLRRP